MRFCVTVVVHNLLPKQAANNTTKRCEEHKRDHIRENNDVKTLYACAESPKVRKRITSSSVLRNPFFSPIKDKIPLLSSALVVNKYTFPGVPIYIGETESTCLIEKENMDRSRKIVTYFNTSNNAQVGSRIVFMFQCQNGENVKIIRIYYMFARV